MLLFIKDKLIKMLLHIIFHVLPKYILLQKYQLINQNHYNTIKGLKVINSNQFILDIIFMEEDIHILSMIQYILL